MWISRDQPSAPWDSNRIQGECPAKTIQNSDGLKDHSITKTTTILSEERSRTGIQAASPTWSFHGSVSFWISPPEAGVMAAWHAHYFDRSCVIHWRHQMRASTAASTAISSFAHLGHGRLQLGLGTLLQPILRGTCQVGWDVWLSSGRFNVQYLSGMSDFGKFW